MLPIIRSRIFGLHTFFAVGAVNSKVALKFAKLTAKGVKITAKGMPLKELLNCVVLSVLCVLTGLYSLLRTAEFFSI